MSRLSDDEYKKKKNDVLNDWRQTAKDSVSLANTHNIPSGTIRKWIIKEKKKTQAAIGRFQTNVCESIPGYRGLVITSCTNDMDINVDAYLALKRYCVTRNFLLMVLPVWYKATAASKFLADESDMFMDDVQVLPNLRIASSMRVSPTAVNPLAAKDTLSKGQSLIIPHPQVAMRVLPSLDEIPHILHTTGSINKNKGYPVNATGQKAEFNHALAALVVELGEEESFHYRQLNIDENNGFYDINGYWTADDHKPLDGVEAFYMGDEHVSVIDKQVVAAVYTNPDSIVKTMKPKYICRGDVLDMNRVSHHDQHNRLMQIAKAKFGLSNLREEIEITLQHIRDTTPKGVKNLFIGSNHNDHLNQWLASHYAPDDHENSEIYHFLMYLMNRHMRLSADGEIEIPNALKLFVENTEYKDILDYSEFLGRRKSFKIKGIEVSLHGDVGFNGAKGSPNSYSKMSVKVVHGHSHTPGIMQGCYTVGTFSRKNLSYTRGPSSWMHTLCVIYPNGKRQLINIINGKWRI